MTNYKKEATEARKKVLEMIHRAGTSHIGSNLSVIDIATVLYSILSKEDKVIWSKGWAAATAYYFLAKTGVIPVEDLEKFPNEPYIGLLEPKVKGVLTSGGSMGHGLPVAVGLAIGLKKLGSNARVFCIMSDGEMNCGTTWESAMLAAHHKLDNLTVIVDKNTWQAMGRTNDVLNTEPLLAKWQAFGFEGIEIDGHDHNLIEQSLNMFKAYCGKTGQPQVIVAKTVKGKGVSFMEDYILFHYKHVTKDEYDKAIEELNRINTSLQKI